MERALRYAALTLAVAAAILIILFTTMWNHGNDEWLLFTDGRIEIEYPSVASIRELKPGFAVLHSIPYEHSDPCALPGGSAKPVKDYTDLSVRFRLVSGDLAAAMRSNGDDSLIDEHYANGKLAISPGTIDEYAAGSLTGYKVTERKGACGVENFYFPLSPTSTIAVSSKLIGELAPVGGKPSPYGDLPGAFTLDEHDTILARMIRSLKAL